MSTPSSSYRHSHRLRCEPIDKALHVVLVEPEIPPNTGNIARLCAATACSLHLVHPLGFRVDEKAVRRAGLDYWHLVDVRQHADWAAFSQSLEPAARLHFFTGKASRSFYDALYQAGDYLVFGRESRGLPAQLLDQHQAQLVAIPTVGAVRSLNLANCVALGVYEALRQTDALSECQLVELNSD